MMTTTAQAGLPSAFPRVLAVDDDAYARTVFEESLGTFGFDVKTVPKGRVAVNAIGDWAPEAILVGMQLSDIDAFSLMASLRRITDAPILMIGEHCATEKVWALTGGADDCISKPVNLEELAAHIRARLRRPRIETREIVSFADLTIDVTRRKAMRAGVSIDLSLREFDLLLTLARRPGQVFSRAQLLDLVWGVDRDVTPATVETYISYLRAKIDVHSGAQLIHTMRGIGYAMRLPMSTVA